MQEIGKSTMAAIARSVTDAITAAHLSDWLPEFNRRLMLRDEAVICDTEIRDGVCHWAFKPYVELALYEIRATARTTRLTPHEKRDHFRHTLTIAGL